VLTLWANLKTLHFRRDSTRGKLQSIKAEVSGALEIAIYLEWTQSIFRPGVAVFMCRPPNFVLWPRQLLFVVRKHLSAIQGVLKGGRRRPPTTRPTDRPVHFAALDPIDSLTHSLAACLPDSLSQHRAHTVHTTFIMNLLLVLHFECWCAGCVAESFRPTRIVVLK
jgi:hypothetical protein